MTQNPNDLEKLLGSPQAANLLKQKDALRALANSPDAQKFLQLLTQKSGGNLQAAANAAMKGDPSQLSRLVDEVKKNPEAAKAVENLSRTLGK